MGKLLVIGIDGLDLIQLSILNKYLPNFNKVRHGHSDVNFTSIFPPDSIPAWGSIYTGLNPAQHGIVEFIDPNNRDRKIVFNDIYKYYKGKTFWDYVSDRGKRVCILLPYSIYPPWPVNGVMVCRTLEIVDEDYPLKTYPDDVYEKFRLSDFNVNLFHGFPSKRNLEKFANSCKRRTIEEGELGIRFLKDFDANFYFIYFSALDAIQHTFWNYYDEGHPDYVEKKIFNDVIKDFYILFDGLIGRFLDNIDQETTVIILSDHGHGMRPVKLVNVNEILRRKGFLNPIRRRSLKKPLLKKELMKKILANFIGKVGIGNSALRLLNKFPILKSSIATADYIDWETTVAYLSAISGIKSYPEGGILINKKFHDSDYYQIRENVINELAEIKDRETSENLMKWICRREELYQGDFITKYPDIIFELKEGYGVGWDIQGEIIGKSSMSRFQPGSHRRYSPVFLISNLDNHVRIKKDLTLMDIKPIILDILGINN